MSEMISRRVFMRGLGVVAAAAALTACSSTNEAVNQALIEGAVGGIVAADCKIGRSRYWAANATVPVNEISFRIVMTNVSSKPVTLSGDNFVTTLDGTPITPFRFSARDVGDADIWRTYDSLTIRPGEERSVGYNLFLLRLSHCCVLPYMPPPYAPALQQQESTDNRFFSALLS